jgi:hypothetical protein
MNNLNMKRNHNLPAKMVSFSNGADDKKSK